MTFDFYEHSLQAFLDVFISKSFFIQVDLLPTASSSLKRIKFTLLEDKLKGGSLDIIGTEKVVLQVPRDSNTHQVSIKCAYNLAFLFPILN